MEKSPYQCQNAVAIIIFNRPYHTLTVLNSIKYVKPKKLYIISDGPRENVEDDYEKVKKCRDLIKDIDWECSIEYNYSDVNLGCMKRVITGLDWVFSLEKQCIILEDDCNPSEGFFEFLDWGLYTFSNNLNVGMISGSNLAKEFSQSLFKNGFSKLINIWGWGTWSRIWNTHNRNLNFKDLKVNKTLIKRNSGSGFFENLYWHQLFKNTVLLSSTWDFQFQHTFFRLGLLSVYPTANLVENIGFDQYSTHMKKKPNFLNNLKETNDIKIKSPIPLYTFEVSKNRDKYVIKKIWKYSLFTGIRLWFTNLFRFLNI